MPPFFPIPIAPHEALQNVIAIRQGLTTFLSTVPTYSLPLPVPLLNHAEKICMKAATTAKTHDHDLWYNFSGMFYHHLTLPPPGRPPARLARESLQLHKIALSL